MSTKIGWGFGGLADNYIMNSINVLGLSIYTIYFHMDPKLAGIAMFIPRFIDAIFDPLAGHISDNTRSKWGRRRPYIVCGALLSAVLMPFLYTPPFTASASLPMSQWMYNIPFLYFTVMQILYSLSYSLFVVPYTALGYELTNDYDEKTRTLAWRMYIGLAGSMTVPWLYKLCVLPVFGKNDALGACVVSLGLAVIVIVTGLLPVFYCKEREDVQKQETINILEAVKYTFINKPFMILTVAYIVIIVGLFSASNLNNFINIYYVCANSNDPKGFAGKIGGLAGSAGAITSYISMFLIARFSQRWSKGFGMNLGLSFALAGVLLSWFALDPRHPYWQIYTMVISCLGLQGCWLMISSMVADVCDEDEVRSGLRREGMFGAVNSFSLKVALALTSLIGGYLLAFSGFDPKAADVAGISLHTALTMKGLIIGFQAVGLVLAIIIFLGYPITRERAAETRRILDERKRLKEMGEAAKA